MYFWSGSLWHVLQFSKPRFDAEERGLFIFGQAVQIQAPLVDPYMIQILFYGFRALRMSGSEQSRFGYSNQNSDSPDFLTVLRSSPGAVVPKLFSMFPMQVGCSLLLGRGIIQEIGLTFDTVFSGPLTGIFVFEARLFKGDVRHLI